MNNSDFFILLRETLETVPARQKRVCGIILDQSREVALMTVEQLADAAGVGVGTVVRTAQALGFSGFGELSARLKGFLIKRELPLWWQLESSWGEGGAGQEDFFRAIYSENVESIQRSYTEEGVANLKRCIRMIRDARKVGILGLRSTFGVASYFAGLLMEFRDNVINLGQIGSDSMFATLADFTEKDLLFAISLGGPQYSSRVYDAARFAEKNKIPVAALVSSDAHPIIKHAGLVLTVAAPGNHYSVVSAVTVIEALVAAIGGENKALFRKKLQKVTAILEETGIVF